MPLAPYPGPMTRHGPSLLWPGIPAGLTGLLCLLLRQEPAAILAPVLGPWAGMAFGHLDCTMGTVLPLPSVLLAVVRPGLLYLWQQHGGRWLWAVLLWDLPWLAAALLSVLNSLS